MESNRTGGGAGAKPAIRFGFSWADEVEREEREQQEEGEEEERRRGTVREQQIKAAGPFGAARPREVVLAEKGVDWRARDRELDLPLRPAPRPPRSRRRAAATTAAAGAGAAQDAEGDGRTPRPRGRRAASSSPSAPPGSRSGALRGNKRKCAGEGPVPSRAVGDQRRKVFGELNLGEGCGSSIRGAASKGCDSGGSGAEGIKSCVPAAADAENRGGSVLATEVTAAEVAGSAVAQKKRRKKKKGGKRKSGRGSKQLTQNPQTPPL